MGRVMWRTWLGKVRSCCFGVIAGASASKNFCSSECVGSLEALRRFDSQPWREDLPNNRQSTGNASLRAYN